MVYIWINTIHRTNCVSYWALCDVLGPLVHVGALFNGGAAFLVVIPATIRVPSLHAVTNVSSEISQLLLLQNYQVSL